MAGQQEWCRHQKQHAVEEPDEAICLLHAAGLCDINDTGGTGLPLHGRKPSLLHHAGPAVLPGAPWTFKVPGLGTVCDGV